MRSTPSAADAPAEALPGGRLYLTTEGVAWLGIALLLGFAGWYKSLNLVFILAYAMAALLILNGILARAHARRVTATRTSIPPLFAGETGRVIVTARNAGEGAATVGVTEEVGGDATTWLLHRVAPGGSLTSAEERQFPTRGRFRGSPLLVWSAFPFGLMRFDRSVDGGGDVVVLPTPGGVVPEGMRRWLSRQAGYDGRSRKVLRRVTTDHADVRGVRPYRQGDSQRAIHWRSSARRGELMVREYDAAPSPELVLVVEPWLPVDPTDRQREKLEAALSLAATVVREWCTHYGTRLTVVVAGKQTAVLSGPPSEAFAREALVPLADARGRPTFAPIGPEAFDRSLGQSARVVVSSRRGGLLASNLTQATGRPFVALDPTSKLPWYQPPAGAVGQEAVRQSGEVPRV